MARLLRLSASVAIALMLAACASTSDQFTGVIGSVPNFDDGDQVLWTDARARWETADGKPAPLNEVAPELWVYEKGTLAVRLKASPQLNLYRGEPHTVLLKIYQVADPAALAGELDSGLGLRRLLTRQEATDPPDPTILGVQRVILEPGADRLLALDRAPLARYLVVVAGFNELDVAASTRVIPIPGVRDYPKGWRHLKPENWGVTASRINPWDDPLPARPARLELWLEFGADKIEKLEVRAR